MNTVFDTYIDILTESVEVKETGGVKAYRLINFSGNVASASEKPLGVTRFAGEKNVSIPVGVIGIFPVEAASAIAVGTRIGPGTSGGKAQSLAGNTLSDLNKSCAYALTAASADGDIIRALFVP